MKKNRKFCSIGEILNDKKINLAIVDEVPGPGDSPQVQAWDPLRFRPSEKVVGGDILRKPVDRTAALVVSRCPWWAILSPVSTPKPKEQKVTPKRKKKKMPKSGYLNLRGDPGATEAPPHIEGQDYVSEAGIRIKIVNGQPMFDLEDVDRRICEEVSKLVKQANPAVQAAQDARKIMNELLNGIGDEMDRFKIAAKSHLDEIRQTRFAVVRECQDMIGPMKDVRQFFIGDQHKEQIERLREFVDLCERLVKLQQSGFLDRIVDAVVKTI